MLRNGWRGSCRRHASPWSRNWQHEPCSFKRRGEGGRTRKQAQQSLHGELGRSSRREAHLKQQIAALEKQLQSLNQTLGETRQDLAQESEKRLAAEQQAAQLVQERTRLEQQIADVSTFRLTPPLEQGVEKAHQSQRTGAQAALLRETQLKQQRTTLEHQLETLNHNLDQLRQDLSDENGRRLAVEQQATQLLRRPAGFEQDLAARTAPTSAIPGTGS